MFRTTTCLAALLALTLTAFVGCESSSDGSVRPADLDLNASRTSIFAGENVTFTADTENTYGRDAEIKWSTTGGDLAEIEDGIRQVTFEEPGNYTVTADLMIDDRRVSTDSVDISVKPLE